MNEDKLKILNIKINKESLSVILNRIFNLLADNKKFYICVLNSFVIVKANNDPELLKIINNAEIVIPDGMPLVWYSKTFKNKLSERIDGFKFFYEFSKIANQKGYSYYFLGADSEEILTKIKERLNKEFSNIIIKGFYCPPFMDDFSDDLNEEMVKKINDVKPDVLWVGLSAPKQEKFIYNNFEKMHIKMAAGIGAGFNFYSGSVNRAPVWLQKSGFEWLHRAFSEPNRLLRKYLIHNTKFILLVFKDLIKRLTAKLKNN